MKYSWKRIGIVFLLVAMVVLLSSCKGEEAKVYTVHEYDKDFLVDTVNQTVTVDGICCSYEITERGKSRTLKVTYPDGSRYYDSFDGIHASVATSEDYDETKYVPGNRVVHVLIKDAPVVRKLSGEKIAAGILLVIVGVVEVAFPYLFWFFRYGWRFRNSEPSDEALVFVRIGGVLFIVVGAFLLLSA